MFARRTGWPLEPNPLSRAIAARRQRGLAVIDLTESNPTRCGFRYASDAILRALSQPAAMLYAPEPHGPLAARRAVAAWYAERGASVEPDQIFLTASTSEAYFQLFRLLAEPGDAVLVPQPSYPLFDFLAALSDLEIAPYPLAYAAGWRIDLEKLEHRIGRAASAGRAPRALVVVHPNNPTGSFLSADELAALGELCRRHSMALIADEVFSDYRFEPSPPGRAFTHAGFESVLTFTLSGLSKVCALPQMKLAWIVASGPPEVRRAAVDRLEIIADTFLSVNTPVAAALPELLATRRAIQSQILARLRCNRAELKSQIAASGTRARLLQAEGGWYAVLGLEPESRRAPDDDTLAVDLAANDGVVVHPGHFYGFPADGWLVLSLLPREEEFSAGIEKIWPAAG
jgi:alanine-synthesizing transaminase